MRAKELTLAVVAIVAVMSCGLLLPCTQTIRNGERHVYSAVSLKSIGHALHNYYDTHRKWPPAVVTDAQGKPLYSWRVLLLPFLEQEPLYKQFKLDEAWDSPANRKLLEKTPDYYSPHGGTDDPAGTTRYQAIVGRGTAWESPNLRLDKDFPDGTNDTIMVAEAAKPVPWSQPADLEYDPKEPLPVLSDQYSKAVGHFLCYVTKRVQGSNVLFADGSVRFQRAAIDPDVLRAMLTRNGGEKVAAAED